MLTPVNTIENCFCFIGSVGRIQIGLSKQITVAAVTIDHAAFALKQQPDAAPKNFVIYVSIYIARWKMFSQIFFREYETGKLKSPHFWGNSSLK